MAFEKFKMKRQSDWSQRKREKDQSVWRKQQRNRKNNYKDR